MTNEMRPEINFLQDAFQVSDALNGVQIEVNGKRAEITATQPYTRDENEPSPYDVILHRRPGELVIVPFLQHGLPAIVTIEGGCALIRGVNILEQETVVKEITRPGVVSRELGLLRGGVYTLEIVTQQPPLIRAKLSE